MHCRHFLEIPEALNFGAHYREQRTRGVWALWTCLFFETVVRPKLTVLLRAPKVKEEINKTFKRKFGSEPKHLAQSSTGKAPHTM